MGRVNITEIIFRGRGSTLQTDFGEPLLVGDNQIAEIGLKSFSEAGLGIFAIGVTHSLFQDFGHSPD